MNAEDLRSKSVDELDKMIVDLRKEQMNTRFQQAQGAMENTAQILKTRRTIARAKTILNQKSKEETVAEKVKKTAAKKTSAKKKVA